MHRLTVFLLVIATVSFRALLEDFEFGGGGAGGCDAQDGGGGSSGDGGAPAACQP